MTVYAAVVLNYLNLSLTIVYMTEKSYVFSVVLNAC